jgi:hypothetical protein
VFRCPALTSSTQPVRHFDNQTAEIGRMWLNWGLLVRVGPGQCHVEVAA